jgi:predicted amidohydrolase YtcJ
MATTLVTASTIYAGDPPAPGPTAMHVEDGRITWLGGADEAAPRPGAASVDLGDAAVIPGFIDCHQHMIALLWTANWIDCRDVRSPEECVVRLTEHAASGPFGTWLVGWGYDAIRAAGGRRCDRSMLDSVSTKRPVLVEESSFHQGSANSAALAAVGFGRSTPQAFGGELERDRTGEPTGVAWERAFGVLDHAARRAEARSLGGSAARRAREVGAGLLAQGVTHIGEALADPPLIELARESGLAVGVTVMPASGKNFFATPWDALDGPRTGEGDDRVRIGHLKLFADGAERCAISIPLRKALGQTGTMLWRAARARDAGGLRLLGSAGAKVSRGRLQSGTLHYPPGALAEVMAEALRRGFLIAVHALGNRGVREALDSYEEARRRTGVDVAGCRIEHAMLADGEDFDRAASLNLIISMQPGHAVHYAHTLRASGVDRALDPVALRRALDSGCRLAISSDGPTAPGTALENMRAAVDRLTGDGTPIRPDLAITPEEALRAATLGGAEASGVAESKGSLAVGKRADFVVLSGEPFDRSTVVRETWLAGVPAWGRPA